MGRGRDDEIVVDACGLRCPWPVLRLARAMREGGAHARVRILTDDAKAPAEIAALAAERGWSCEPSDEAGSCAIVVSSAQA